MSQLKLNKMEKHKKPLIAMIIFILLLFIFSYFNLWVYLFIGIIITATLACLYGVFYTIFNGDSSDDDIY